MNILFIAYTDMSKRNGGSICTKSYIDVFADVADKIILALPLSAHYTWDFSGIQLLEVPERPLLSKLRHSLFGVPHRFFPFLKKKWDTIGDVDLVVLSGSILSCGITEFIKKKNVPIVCIHHNFEADYHKDNKTKVSLYGINLSRIKKIEKNALIQSTLNFTLTENDRIKLQQYYSLQSIKISTIGCFLEKETKKESLCTIDNKKIVITGALCDQQTEDGIIWYLTELHSIVETLIPNVTVYIAGRNPAPSLVKLCQKTSNVILLPNPQNMEEIVKDAWLFINPTRLGSGLKLRNMDALKLGVPVLAHIKSCAGYECMLDKGVYGYESYADFQQSLLELLIAHPNKNEIQDRFYSCFSYEIAKRKIIKELQQANLF